MHRKRLVRHAQFLARDAAEALRLDLGLGDAHDVLVGHAHGQMPRGFIQQIVLARRYRVVRGGNGGQPVEVEPCVSITLIGGEPAHAFDRGGLRGGRKFLRDFVFERLKPGGGALLIVRGFRRLCFGARGFEPGMEAAQIAVHRFAVGTDGRFQLLGRQRQAPAAGNGAEHHRIDDRAALLGKLVHVDQQRVARMILDDLDEPDPGRSGRRPWRSFRPWHRSGWSNR